MPVRLRDVLVSSGPPVEVRRPRWRLPVLQLPESPQEVEHGVYRAGIDLGAGAAHQGVQITLLRLLSILKAFTLGSLGGLGSAYTGAAETFREVVENLSEQVREEEAEQVWERVDPPSIIV